jgi:excisionase family DNA binding protein
VPASVPPSPSLSPELLTVNQVAELLGVSARMVWLLAAQSKLAPVRIRRCTRWRRADVLCYIDRLSAPQAAKEAGRD